MMTIIIAFLIATQAPSSEPTPEVPEGLRLTSVEGYRLAESTIERRLEGAVVGLSKPDSGFLPVEYQLGTLAQKKLYLRVFLPKDFKQQDAKELATEEPFKDGFVAPWGKALMQCSGKRTCTKTCPGTDKVPYCCQWSCE